MAPRISRWFHDSIAVERGPLVFSYGIGESWVKLRDRGMTADWQVFPSTAWNYALNVDAASPAKSITVTEAEVGPAPFSRHSAPVQLSVKARKLVPWRAEDGVANRRAAKPCRERSAGRDNHADSVRGRKAAHHRVSAQLESECASDQLVESGVTHRWRQPRTRLRLES